MKVNVLLFGNLAEEAGKESIEVNDIFELERLRKHMSETYPFLDKIKFQVSVNKNLVSGNVSLKDGDEIAFLPPFSGG